MPRFKRQKKVSKATKNYVKAELSRTIENKHFNQIVQQTAVNAMDNLTGVVFALAGMANGSAINQRLGNSVRIKKVMMDWTVTCGTNTPTICRILVVQDKQQTGTNPTLNQVVDAGGTGLGTFQATVTPFNVYNTPTRFTVLHDWRFNIDPTDNIFKQKRMVIPGSKISQVHYQSAGTLDGKGQLYAFCYSDIQAISNLCPRLICGIRVDYEDA